MSVICNIFILLTLQNVLRAVFANNNITNNNIVLNCSFIPNSDDEHNLQDGLQSPRFVSRSEWLAIPPNGELSNLNLPVHRVIIAHTATEPCDSIAQCTFKTRFIQTFHIESRGFDDIAYNFLIGGDGSIYEGRGWNKIGAHTKGFNKDSIGIGFIGSFGSVIPPKIQLSAAKLLIKNGIELGKLSSDYNLYGHRQLTATESPGQALFNIIKTWPHFSTNIIREDKFQDLHNRSFDFSVDNTSTSFKYISRSEWIAQEPTCALKDLKLPVMQVIIAHTATEACTFQAECVVRTRFIQKFHMNSRGSNDIAYNFLVGGDGSVYEGRGWNKIGAHTKRYNAKSICIAFIGDFTSVLPEKQQFKAVLLLIEEGIKLGKLSKDYELYGQRQLVKTESPGKALFEIIELLPHFVNESKNENITVA